MDGSLAVNGRSVALFAGTFLLSMALVWVTLLIARRHGWYDGHNERKVHIGQIPRLGGIGFVLAFVVALLVCGALAPAIGLEAVIRPTMLPVLLAMPLVLVFGVVDDFKALPPKVKIAVQLIAALLVVIPDFTFHRLDLPLLGIHLALGWLRFPLTMFWIVGITNAMNLLDGLDGLAGGVALIVAGTFAAMFVAAGNDVAAVLCILLVAAVLGFLVFNWPLPRARIFMGDGGSQFLGFVLAFLPLISHVRGVESIPLFYAAAVLLIPIVDTFAAIWRRKRDGRRIDSPDKAHMHHKLLNIGLSGRGVILVVYALQLVTSTLVVLAYKHLMNFPRGTGASDNEPLLGAAYAVVFVFFTLLHYMNRYVNRKKRGAKQQMVNNG